jgi:serine/threonine-protein kinase
MGEARRESWTTKDLGARLTPAGSGPRIIADDPPQSSALFAPGAIVADKYEIEGVLGEGGLGVVVAATHLHLDQKVAIKYLRGSAPRDRSMTDRFLREARLAAQIKSEHVVRVFDVATLADGTPYMVMEHLEGADLRTRLADSGAVPFSAAVDYVLQACEALAEAHVQGIVHRDLKPDNLFLARVSGGKDVLKILDFGISKLSDKYTSSSRVNVVTQAGDRLGTPLYMSPEQLEGSPNVDARTDLWAIGVVLYELCTGAIPFTGDSLPALCTAILTKTPVPATTLVPGLPSEIDLIVGRCLAKNRDDRYQNVAELAEELAPFASTAGQTRARHTAQIVLDSGDTVRPPRFGPSVPAPAQPSDAPPIAGAPTHGNKLLIAAIAVAACVAVVALGRSRASSPVSATVTSSTTVTSTPAVPAPAASTATAPTISRAAAPAVAPVAADPVPEVSAPAPGAPSVPSVRPRVMPTPAAGAAAPTRAPASADTTGVLDPFQ